MVRLWCLAFSLFVFGANFNFAKADFEDLFDDDRIRDNFFGRDHEEFFDNIGRLIGVVAGIIFAVALTCCVCCCLCPFCLFHKSRRGQVLGGQGNQTPQQQAYQQQPQTQGGAYPLQQQQQTANYPPQQPAMGYPPQQEQPAMGYPPQNQQPAMGYPPHQQQPAMGYPPQQQYHQSGAQGAYPPPSGFQQYPPPYPGSAVENAPPLATKSDDYNRQSAFNPNI